MFATVINKKVSIQYFQYLVLPWPDSLAIYVAGLLHGQVNYHKIIINNLKKGFC